MTGVSSTANRSAAGLLVRPEVAARQLQADRAAAAVSSGTGPTDKTPDTTNGSGGTEIGGEATSGGKSANARPNRYYGSIVLDAARVGRDAGKIADEVIAHLSGLVGAQVTVTLEIAASIPDGAPDNVVRIVTENGRTLKFSSQGFDRDAT
jgi:hypothetical protein